MKDGHSIPRPTGHRDGVRLAKTPNPTARSHPQIPWGHPKPKPLGSTDQRSSSLSCSSACRDSSQRLPLASSRCSDCPGLDQALILHLKTKIEPEAQGKEERGSNAGAGGTSEAMQLHPKALWHRDARMQRAR